MTWRQMDLTACTGGPAYWVRWPLGAASLWLSYSLSGDGSVQRYAVYVLLSVLLLDGAMRLIRIGPKHLTGGSRLGANSSCDQHYASGLLDLESSQPIPMDLGPGATINVRTCSVEIRETASAACGWSESLSMIASESLGSGGYMSSSRFRFGRTSR